MTLHLYTRTDLERAARLALWKWRSGATVTTARPDGQPDVCISDAVADVADQAEPVFTRDEVKEASMLAAQLAVRATLADTETPDFEKLAEKAVRAIGNERGNGRV